MFNLSIRRALVISGLFVGAATLLATPTKVMAAPITDSVNLSGEVVSTLAMTKTVATELDFIHLGSVAQEARPAV